MPTPKQIRAARVYLDWSQEDLASYSGLAISTIRNLEGGTNSPSGKSAHALDRAFAGHIDFLENGGIQPKQEAIFIHKGRSGFVDFFWDVHSTVEEHGGEICVSNVSEDDFDAWFDPEEAKKYDEAMASLKKNYQFKCLVKEGDTNFVGSRYAEYRWSPAEEFGSVPFYVYGDNLAIILFGDDVSVYVMKNAEIASAYRGQFNSMWTRAKIPSVRKK